jgi:hypothetical protein
MIAVAGTIVVDFPAHLVARVPDRGGLEAVERIDLYVGGAVANTGMTLSRLGVPVGAIGCVGKDSLGRIVMEELSGWAEGIWIHEDETRSTSATIVLVHPDGERTFILQCIDELPPSLLAEGLYQDVMAAIGHPPYLRMVVFIEVTLRRRRLPEYLRNFRVAESHYFVQLRRFYIPGRSFYRQLGVTRRAAVLGELYEPYEPLPTLS